jgi:hypothetical protein
LVNLYAVNNARYALLENSAITGMLDLSMRLILQDWPAITFLNGNQMDKKKWKPCALWDSHFFSLSPTQHSQR